MSSDSFLSDTEDDSGNGEEEDVIDVEGQVEDSEPVHDDTNEVTSNSIVKPADDIKEVARLYEKFEEIKEELLGSNDVVSISGSPHVTKSGWRKIATAFNVSTELLEKNRVDDKGIVKYTVVVEARAPNGKTATGTGMATSNESNFTRKLVDGDHSLEEAKEEANYPDAVIQSDGWYREIKSPKEVNEHNLLTLAETRAKNRAISDLVGGGEVSAEEMTADMAL